MDGVNDRAAEFTERLQDALAFSDVAAVAGDHRYQGSPIRGMKERGISSEFVGSGFDVVTEVADDIDSGVARIEQKAAQDSVHRVSLEFERCDHPEVPTPAPRRAQKRSSFSEALAVRTLPSAVTIWHDSFLLGDPR